VFIEVTRRGGGSTHLVRLDRIERVTNDGTGAVLLILDPAKKTTTSEAIDDTYAEFKTRLDTQYVEGT